MSGSEASAPGTGHSARRGAHVVGVVVFLALPVVVGVGVALRWPDANGDTYSAVAQIIGTLFIAIVLEFFGRDRPFWDDTSDLVAVLGLIAFSWLGLFGCVRGMLDGGSAWTVALAASGLTSASVLVSLSLFARLRIFGPSRVVTLVLVAAFVFPPMLLLVIV